jgi:hypothetical protein
MTQKRADTSVLNRLAGNPLGMVPPTLKQHFVSSESRGIKYNSNKEKIIKEGARKNFAQNAFSYIFPRLINTFL